MVVAAVAAVVHATVDRSATVVAAVAAVPTLRRSLPPQTFPDTLQSVQAVPLVLVAQVQVVTVVTVGLEAPAASRAPRTVLEQYT